MKNIWGTEGDGSGAGSDIQFTTNMRQRLITWMIAHNIRSMVDVSCGSALWTTVFIKDIQQQLPDFKYYGYDVSEEAIKRAHNHLEGVPNVVLGVADMRTLPIPDVDLILCRDSLQHLSSNNGKIAIANFISSSCPWLIIGGCHSPRNHEITDGFGFDFNPQLPPYILVTKEIIPEGHPLIHGPNEREKMFFVYETKNLK
jgi:hypothetical protein